MDIQPAEEPPGLPSDGHEPAGAREAALTRHQRQGRHGDGRGAGLARARARTGGARGWCWPPTSATAPATRAALHHSEEQLRQAQRLDAAGRLAGGVAHDFNNILTTIRGFGDILLRQLPEDDPRRADADQIRQGRRPRRRSSPASSWPSASGHAPSPRALDLHQAVGTMEGSDPPSARGGHRARARLRAGSAEVRMDPGHLDQMLVNIILNARDAMPGGGVLTIETAERQISARAKGRRVRPGATCCSRSATPAPEWMERRRTHLFEPFQLARTPPSSAPDWACRSCYGIVRQNGGVAESLQRAGPGHHREGVSARRRSAGSRAGSRRPELLRGTRPCSWWRTRTACGSWCGRS